MSDVSFLRSTSRIIWIRSPALDRAFEETDRSEYLESRIIQNLLYIPYVTWKVYLIFHFLQFVYYMYLSFPLQTRIFTYSIGKHFFSTGNLRKMACNNRGMFQAIPSNSGTHAASRKYLNVLSKAIAASPEE